ncbi:MAG: 50S ribosomal protein L30 [Candidatus Thermoplasmatota archaeon]
MVYAAVRVKGKINIKPDTKKTLQLLNLTRANHCVILPENKKIKGMLQTAKDYITWGEINQDILSKMIQERGRLEGDQPVNKDHLKKETSYKDVKSLVEAIIKGKTQYKEIPSVKPIFRLSPPEKGYRSVKKPYSLKGSLGYRGEKINDLLERMI